MRYSVRHRTFYRYGERMSSGQSLGHLTPRTTPNQTLVSSSITVAPEPEEVSEWLDAFGNPVNSFTITSPHETLEVVATSLIDVTVPVLPDISEPWETIMSRLPSRFGALDVEAQQFVLPSPFIPYLFELHTLAKEAFTPGRPFLEAFRALNSAIYTTYSFDPSFSDVSTPLGDVLLHRRGVCQDFAHLMTGALRSIGLAARYVSGYIETEPPPGEAKLVGSDASHAWCSVYVPDVGWIDADPTNNQIPPHRHVTVAWGRDYGDVAPLRGVVLGPSATQAMKVEVDVNRLATASTTPTAG
ncbi:MAG: transglutaminase [Ilumatobacteraceae bacterium]|nr:transglutaminase [Ilumatobacteraceae bacterium]